jgi:hypothetical protein
MHSRAQSRVAGSPNQTPPSPRPPARRPSSLLATGRTTREALARWRAAGAVSLALLALSLAPSVEAQSESAQARVLFREARKLMDKGSHAEACPKLEESLRLDSGIGTQFNLAHCWEQVGRTASAWGLFMDVAAAAETAGQKKRAKAAQQRAAALEPNLMRLIIEVPKPSEALSVQRAGEEVGAAAWGTPMPIDPGSHRVEASAPGKLPWSQEVELLVPGETVTVVIPALEDENPAPAEPVAVAQPDRAEPVEQDAGSSRGWRTAGTIAMAVVGVGGVVTGAVFAMSSSDETAAARELCVGGDSGNVCDRGAMQPGFDGGVREQDELRKHRDKAESDALVSYVALGVGAAALAGSAILLFTSPGSERPPSDEAALELHPTLAPGLAGVALGGKF